MITINTFFKYRPTSKVDYITLFFATNDFSSHCCHRFGLMRFKFGFWRSSLSGWWREWPTPCTTLYGLRVSRSVILKGEEFFSFLQGLKSFISPFYFRFFMAMFISSTSLPSIDEIALSYSHTMPYRRYFCSNTLTSPYLRYPLWLHFPCHLLYLLSHLFPTFHFCHL